MIWSRDRSDENSINWLIELKNKTSTRIGYKIYPQTAILSKIDTDRLLDLASINCTVEVKQRDRMFIELDHNNFCHMYGLTNGVGIHPYFSHYYC